ncbi:GFA family protein [Sphingopyxis sp. MSC1_008]|uniref:GFA family protein n=1 Tax=Sphingopyxis sp. MSC1_008 TaxID=2909265 RepID=UPI0020BE442B|nr:GFA family protein [Sphingopyxis sp. MSC1_008]
MTRTITGACLCGGASFEIVGEFDAFYLCHCSRCRKGSGSAHGANLFSATAKLNWLSGQDKVKSYRLPATRHQRDFCSECGSGLPREVMQGAMLVVPAGSIDSAIDIRPTAHICCDSRAGWDADLETVPKIGGLPG